MREIDTLILTLSGGFSGLAGTLTQFHNFQGSPLVAAAPLALGLLVIGARAGTGQTADARGETA